MFRGCVNVFVVLYNNKKQCLYKTGLLWIRTGFLCKENTVHLSHQFIWKQLLKITITFFFRHTVYRKLKFIDEESKTCRLQLVYQSPGNM